jgi:hypothetical protein
VVQRFLDGDAVKAAVAVMGTEPRGASNAEAKRELGWTARYASWRQGFVAAYGLATAHRAARVSRTPGARSAG